MEIDGEGLSDFGTGAFTGASTGAKVSGGNPYAVAAGALAGGAISYFGGAPRRKLEKKNNELSIRSMEQDNELADLTISSARRKKYIDAENEKKKYLFGQMLAEYFQKQAVV